MHGDAALTRNNVRFAYAGCFTTAARRARGRGIGIYGCDDAGWTARGVLAGLVNPSFLLTHPHLPILYAVHGDADYASAFAADRRTGALRLLGRSVTRGINGVHQALDPTARHLVVANYGSGTLAVLPVRDDGRLADAAHLLALPGTPGPHRREQTMSHPHHVVFDPSGKFILVPDKGLDRVFVITFEDGTLRIASETLMRPGAGPRHIVFHPDGRFTFLVNELDSTVATLVWDAAAASLRIVDIVSCLRREFSGASTAAAIVVTSDGRHVYASNRGEDDIFCGRFDVARQRLEPAGWTGSQGHDPRFMTLSPGGATLLVANEQSGNIIEFSIDKRNGVLTALGAAVEAPSACSIAFL